MEEVNTGESWNKKRILIAMILLIALIAGGYYLKTRVLGEDLFQQLKLVKGANTQEKPVVSSFNLNIQEAVKDKINSIRQEVSGLDISEIASSSPQVRKILNDIKGLQEYPTNQIKEICRKVCGL